MRLLPSSVPADVTRIVTGRAVRGFADGFASVLLAQYLIGLGFSPVEVGAIVTGTLIGSAALPLGFGFTAHRFTLRTLLLAATGLMAMTGLGFRDGHAVLAAPGGCRCGNAEPMGW